MIPNIPHDVPNKIFINKIFYMNTINTKASNAVDNVAIAASVLSWLCIIAGVIMFILTISLDGPIWLGFVIVGAGLLGFMTKALISGFQKVVLASELYIHANSLREL